MVERADDAGVVASSVSIRPTYTFQDYFAWTGDPSMTDAVLGLDPTLPLGRPWDELLPPLSRDDLLSSSALRRSVASYAVLTLTGIGLSGVPVSRLQALPVGPTVVQGSATVTQTAPNALTVNQHSEKVIINWTSFNVGVGELVNFLQGGQHWQALNRDLSGAVSQIAGQVKAPGQFLLSNAAGVHITPTARIDVGALVATTANIPDSAFMAGKMQFNLAGRADGAVVNQGAITIGEGGMAALVAPGVENAGVVNARLGKVALASGNTFTIDLYGDQLV